MDSNEVTEFQNECIGSIMALHANNRFAHIYTNNVDNE